MHVWQVSSPLSSECPCASTRINIHTHTHIWETNFIEICPKNYLKFVKYCLTFRGFSIIQPLRNRSNFCGDVALLTDFTKLCQILQNFSKIYLVLQKWYKQYLPLNISLQQISNINMNMFCIYHITYKCFNIDHNGKICHKWDI